MYQDENNNEYPTYNRSRRAPRPSGYVKINDFVNSLPELIKEHINDDLLNQIIEHADKLAYLIVAYFILTAHSKLLILAVLIILYYHFK